MNRFALAIAGAAFPILLLSGCHGGNSQSVLPTNTLGTDAPATRFASLSVVVAAPAAGVTTPQSLEVSLVQVNGMSPSSKPKVYTMNLHLGSNGCTALTGGAMSCTANVPAPPGNVKFALTTYAGVNGTGKQIASSEANATVTAVAATACPPTARDAMLLSKS